MKNLIIRVPDDLHKKLKQMALDQSSSIQQIMLKLVEEAVLKQDRRKAR